MRDQSGSNRSQSGPATRGPTGSGSEPRLRLRVTAAAEGAIRCGHPWVFADSVRAQNRAGQLGEMAVIYDRQDRFCAIGLFDPESPLRVRVLHAGKPVTLDTAWWQGRLHAAIARRTGLFDAETNGYRVIHGENDGWPGLVLDRYGDTLVMKIYTAAWLPRLTDTVSLVAKAMSPKRLIVRLSRNIETRMQSEFNVADGQIFLGDPPVEPVVFLESGIRFEAEVVRGQKTGFFLDQRENRRLVETVARGAEVLNAFSFSGGFSLYAARGGAKSVTDLDISAHALDSARRNFALNAAEQSIARCRHETVQADTFDWLTQTRRSFDLIILDPPSLARRETERAGAIKAYARLGSLGLERLRAGGMLVSASCSAHVSTDEFFSAVRGVARQSRRRFSEWRTTGHPPDHPATFPEAYYLKCIYLRVAE
jgi:23S rRNA (cytosine1962-C5)-methyltransferase